jgi:hypothetical protein
MKHLLFFALLLSCLTMTATPISILNPSFEAQTFVEGTCVHAHLVGPPPTGWSGGGTIGACNPSTTQYIPTHGDNIGYTASGALTQVLSDVYSPGTTYTLTVDMLRHIQPFTFAGGSLRLEVQAAFGTLVLGEQSVPIDGLALGAVQTLTVTHVSGSASPYFGSPLAIWLSPGSSGQQVQQTGWDNVLLDATPAGVEPVPEPSSLVLGFAGLAVVALLRRAIPFPSEGRR